MIAALHPLLDDRHWYARVRPRDERLREAHRLLERLGLIDGGGRISADRCSGNVVAAVKLQELFGRADSPRLGPDQRTVLFELLAPNGRPVQTTRDLRSFWSTTYQEVRKELRARYPRHPWPEDPWTATATHRTTRRVR